MAFPADGVTHGSHSDICLYVALPFMSVQGRDEEKGKSTRHVHCFKCVSLVQSITPLPHVTNLTRLFPARELDSGLQTQLPGPRQQTPFPTSGQDGVRLSPW